MDSVRLATLLDGLAARDPRVREGALDAVCEAIGNDVLDNAQRTGVADRMLGCLAHGQIQARTFASLVLAALVDHGSWHDSWFARVRSWYLTEADVRGHDAELGWLHAVAHGADFFGAAVHAGRSTPADTLEVLTERVLLPTDVVWRDQEEVRVARAMALALVRDPSATVWLDLVAERFVGVDGVLPPWSTNAAHTLQALALGLEQQILVDGDPIALPDLAPVRTRVVQTIEAFQPWFWRTR